MIDCFVLGMIVHNNDNKGDILMKKKTTAIVFFIGCVMLVLVAAFWKNENDQIEVEDNIKHVTGIILYKDEDSVVVEDEDEKLYEFPKEELEENEGTEVSVDYKDNSTKPPKEDETSKDNTVLDYTVNEESKIPDSWLDGGIFSVHYTKAFQKLQTMSLEEKIGQTLIVRYPTSGATDLINKYNIGGFVFFERDFKGKSKAQVVEMINSSQRSSKIPLLTAIDEEGGRVSRISSNPSLTATPFKSSQEIYNEGGLAAIREDTKKKSSILKGLGLNLNFAPVVDVSTDENDYIYSRTLGKGTNETAEFAKEVIGASKGLGVSYTLKHFPGYGSNADTHLGGSISKKSYEAIMKEDIPPFKAGIDAGAEAVMVSHNTVEAIDSANESSISAKVHALLRNELKFTGVVITDDISMGAMTNVSNIGGKALAAGNDLIITSDVANTFEQIKTSVTNGTVKEDVLNRAVFRVLAWKYYKGLM